MRFFGSKAPHHFDDSFNFISDKIQRYFGETVAMYFAFLGFYTVGLIPPAFIGVLSFLFGRDNVNTMVFFSIFNLVWATVFLEAWKRNCSTLSYKWGMIGFHEFEEPRPKFKGDLGMNEVSRTSSFTRF